VERTPRRPLPSLLSVALVAALLKLSLVWVHVAITAGPANIENLNSHFCPSHLAPMAFLARQFGVLAFEHELTVSGMIERQSLAPPILQGMAALTILNPFVFVWIRVTTDATFVFEANVMHAAIRTLKHLRSMTRFTRGLLMSALELKVGLAVIEHFRIKID
jgi:hypothetical protein